MGKNAPKKNKFILKRDVYLSWKILDSDAFKMLSAKGIQVLLRFLQKRTWAEIKVKRQKKRVYNDKGLSFTYGEAQELGIGTSQFHVILKRLIELGFIDMEHQGGGLARDYSRYALSERWCNYGKPDFKKVVKKRVLQQGLDVQSWKKKRIEKATEKRSCQLRKTVVISEFDESQGIGKA